MFQIARIAKLSLCALAWCWNGGVASAPAAPASATPTKALTLVVPYPAGGPSDSMGEKAGTSGQRGGGPSRQSEMQEGPRPLRPRPQHPAPSSRKLFREVPSVAAQAQWSDSRGHELPLGLRRHKRGTGWAHIAQRQDLQPLARYGLVPKKQAI